MDSPCRDQKKETHQAEVVAQECHEDSEKTSETPSDSNTNVDGNDPEQQQYTILTGTRCYSVGLALTVSLLCLSIDNTILAVAVPQITDDFHVLSDVGWYISAYLLTNCSFMLFFGKLYSLINAKVLLLISILLFEIGSLICALSVNSTMLIAGRALAGFGDGGICVGALVVIATVIEPKLRAMFFSLFAIEYGLASACGPLVGGLLTGSSLTWRWCFYINLPFGFLAAAVLYFILPYEKKTSSVPHNDIFAIIRAVDLGGSLCLALSICCCLIAVQWAGVQYPWSDPRIIGLLVISGLTLFLFCGLEAYLGESALLPRRIVFQRTIGFSCLFEICNGASFFIVAYYLPLWFQVVRGLAPFKASFQILPLILTNVFGSLLSNRLITTTGQYAPWFYISSICMAVGAGLLFTIQIDTPEGALIAYQMIFGFGIGCGFLKGGIAAQAVLAAKDIEVATSLVGFAGIFGGALFVAVGQSLFANDLIRSIDTPGLADLDPYQIAATGFADLVDMVDPSELPKLLAAYNAAIVKAVQLALCLSCCAILGALGIEWKRLKSSKESQNQA